MRASLRVRLASTKRQLLVIVAAQHVVDEALAGDVSACLGDANFRRAGRLRIKAGFANEKIDEQVAGRGLIVVVRIGGGLVGGLDRGDFALQRRDLGLQRETADLR